MKYKAALFDMDGTVLDTIDDLCDSMNHCLLQYGYPRISRDCAMRNLGSGAAYYARRSLPEDVNEKTFHEFLQAYKDWYNTHSCIKTAPFPGIIELLSELENRGVRVGIVSNKPDATVSLLAERFFPGIPAIGESAGIKRKPAPDTVLSMLRRFNVSPEEAVYIGDTEVDIETARNAGTGCVAVTWGFRPAEALTAAPALADTASQLLTLL